MPVEGTLERGGGVPWLLALKARRRPLLVPCLGGGATPVASADAVAGHDIVMNEQAVGAVEYPKGRDDA